MRFSIIIRGRFNKEEAVISRRDFLATGTMGALAMASSPILRAAGSGTRQIGVQLYVVRELLAKDFDGTLSQVAALGIKRVEFAGFYHRSAKQVRASLAMPVLSPVVHIVCRPPCLMTRSSGPWTFVTRSACRT